MTLLAYNLYSDGAAKLRQTLVDYSPEDGADGLVADTEGNLYVAILALSRPGIYVYSPQGKELARVPTPVLPTNVAFGRGDERSTLYVTAGGNLFRIRTKKTGYQLPDQSSRKSHEGIEWCEPRLAMSISVV